MDEYKFGWVRADRLRVGDKVLRRCGDKFLPPELVCEVRHVRDGMVHVDFNEYTATSIYVVDTLVAIEVE